MKSMQKKKKQRQPVASAPENPSFEPASADECFLWTFARMAGDQALEAISKGEKPKVSMLTLGEDGDARSIRLKPSLISAAPFLRSLGRQSLKSRSERLACGFAVSGAGHLLAGVEEAFVVFFLGNESTGAFAHSIKRNCWGKADLEKQHIVVENPLRLLSHAFGFVDHTPDNDERRGFWTNLTKKCRPKQPTKI